MELVLGRFDVASVGSNGMGCMRVLPSNKDAKKKQKLAIGDEQGIVHCLQVKKGETSVVFETPAQSTKRSCTALSLGTLDGERDRLIAAFGNQLVCYQKKKGQILWQHQIEYGESVRYLYCNERLVVYCTDFLVTAMLVDDKGERIHQPLTYQCPDRIQDMLVMLPNPDAPTSFSVSDSNRLFNSSSLPVGISVHVSQAIRGVLGQVVIAVACRDRFVRFIAVR